MVELNSRYHTKYENEIEGLFNQARFKAVYHSSAVDYDHTGHLVTNGIKVLSYEENGNIIHNELESISRWQSASNLIEWIYVDFGCEKVIDKAVVLWDFYNYALCYNLEVSSNGEIWETLIHISDGAGGEALIEFPEISTRYVRLLAIKCVGERYEIVEFELFGKEMPVEKELGFEKMLTTGEISEVGIQKITNSWRLIRASEVIKDGHQLSSAYDDSSWLPAVVPGTVLSSFRKNNSVPDSNYADYQRQISESYFMSDFWYRNTFTIADISEEMCTTNYQAMPKRVWLNFNSINWKADIYVNGFYIGRIEGAFIRGKYDITKYISYNEENYIAVYIIKNDNPGIVREKTMQETGPNGGILGADNPTIHPSVGWDWVPVIRGRNIGIYGDVYLSFTDDYRIENPYITTKFNSDRSATAEFKADIYNLSDKAGTVKVSGYIEHSSFTLNTQERIHFESFIFLEAGMTKEVTISDIIILDANLWYPNGYGEQFLYQAIVEIGEEGKRISDRKSFKFGIREITYMYKPHLEIYVNGTRIYCRGGNWGMDDSNLEATPEDYDIKVRLHAKENFTMIRNWVGQTNHDAFYEACDKYGVLIWDDFWLANPCDGPNPNDEDMFMKNARDKVKRVRGHASLALYCGRNEGNPPASLDEQMKELIMELDRDKLYIPHSAAGVVSGFGPYSVKHPKFYFENAPITLHSERGMPNIPTIESIKRMIPKDYLWPINEMWALHDFTLKSAQGGTSFLESMEKYGEFESLEEFSRYAQMVNYENHKAMFEGVIANKSNGLLMWMSQSAWPSMVWQTYDYYYDLNAAFFAIKTANQFVNPIWHPVLNKVLLANHTPDTLHDITVKVEIYNFNGEIVHTVSKVISVDSADIADVVDIEDFIKMKDNNYHYPISDIIYIKTKAISSDGNIIGENFYWTNTCEYQNYSAIGKLEDTILTGYAELIDESGDMVSYCINIQNKSNVPALLVRVRTTKGKGKEQVLPVYYEDNYFSLMPGEEKTISLEYNKSHAGGIKTAFSVDGYNVLLMQLELR